MSPDRDRCYVFTHFLARPGQEDDVERALAGVLAPTRAEPGCLSIHAFRSLRDDRLFYIHSVWRDAAAFERHAGLPHTVAFVGEIEPHLEHPVRAARMRRLG